MQSEDLRMVNKGKLRNGNHSGDPHKAPRCGAHSRRTGLPCRAPAVRGKQRCRLHGGKSTGPKTPEGIERVSKSQWKTGRHSRKRIESNRKNKRQEKELRAMMQWAFREGRKMYKKPPKV
jgi:hypothetical protein